MAVNQMGENQMGEPSDRRESTRGSDVVGKSQMRD